MKPDRKLSRRSFMTRVVGAAGVAGGAMIVLGGTAQAFQVTDADQAPNADPANRGRGGSGARIRGCTDADSGPNADPPGQGRGNRRSDSDSGSGSDPANCARRR